MEGTVPEQCPQARRTRTFHEAFEVVEADVESSMQHLRDLVGREGVEMRRGVRAVNARGVFTFQGARRAPFGLDWTFPEAGACNGSDIPMVEIIAPREGQGDKLVTVGVDLCEAIAVSEDDVDSGGRPELFNRDERFGEGGNTSDVTQKHSVFFAVPVEGDER